MCVTDVAVQVLLLHDPVDEFVVNALRRFADRDLVSIDAEDVAVAPPAPAAGERAALSESEAAALVAWLKTTLGGAVADVKVRTRVSSVHRTGTGVWPAGTSTRACISI
jgi:HSP90 family molecular chaperone